MPMTAREIADTLEPRSRAALRATANAVLSLRSSGLYADRCPVPNAYSMACDTLRAAVAVHFDDELAGRLLAALLDTGEDFDTCLDLVTGAPQAHLVVVDQHDEFRVLAVALSEGTAWAWVEEHRGEAEGAAVIPVRLLDPPAEPELGDHSAAKEDARAAALYESAPSRGDVNWWEDTTATAVDRMFGEVARRITSSDAFGALVTRVSQYHAAHGGNATDAFHALPADALEFVSRADDPAAFLAAQLSRLL